MLIFVGLGNPGPRHERQRHNVGFLAIDAIAKAYPFGAWRQKFASQICDGTLGDERVLLQKPQTYMNRSGHAVAEAVRFFKVSLQDVVVVHDELDLAAGKVRIKTGGGVAGHNGLRSLADQLGSRDFKRVRIGIGHPGHKERVTGHVLGDFGSVDREWLGPLLDALVAAAPLLATGDDAGCMNKIALLTQPPKADPPKSPISGPGPRGSGSPGSGPRGPGTKSTAAD